MAEIVVVMPAQPKPQPIYFFQPGGIGWHVDTFNEDHFSGDQGDTILKYLQSDATNPADILQVGRFNHTIVGNLTVRNLV